MGNVGCREGGGGWGAVTGCRGEAHTLGGQRAEGVVAREERGGGRTGVQDVREFWNCDHLDT